MATTTFLMYSYKGGSGRTVATCHVAVALARMGYKVVCIDLDMEGPGMRVMFDLNPNAEHYIQKYFLDPDHFDIDGALKSIDLDQLVGKKAKGGVVALCASTDYNLQQTLNFEDLRDRFKSLHQKLEEKNRYDYILIDSPSGYRDATKAALHVTDSIVMIFRWSRQHLVGTITMAKFFDALQFPYILASSAVSPNMKPSKKAAYESFLSESICGLDDNQDRNRTKISTELPEDEILKWNEHILYFDQEYCKHRDRGDILEKYEALAAVMVAKATNES
jgi:hypothetical protein